MARKTAQIPGKPPRHHNADQDKWVSGGITKPKRLTLDISEDLHRRIKVACSVRGTTMVEEITKLLEKEFRP